MNDWRPLEAVLVQVDDGADGLADSYEVPEGTTYEVRPPSRTWAVHPHALPLPDDWEAGREVEVHRCDCKAATTLVRVLACSDGNRWALIKPESMPSSARREGRFADDLAAPLHTNPEGVPHLAMSGCRRCRSRWLVMLYEDSVRLIRLNLVRHGVAVTGP